MLMEEDAELFQNRRSLVLLRNMQKAVEAMRLLRVKARGVSTLRRNPTVKMPSSTKYLEYVADAEKFANAVRFTPTEFNALLSDVRDVMLEARDADARHTTLSNSLRRARAGKFSVEERLFIFLIWLNEYPKFRSLARQMGGGFSSLRADCYWLRRRLVHHPQLMGEVEWPSAEERLAESALMREHGVNIGFDDCVFAVDASKDMSKRARIYAEQVGEEWRGGGWWVVVVSGGW